MVSFICSTYLNYLSINTNNQTGIMIIKDSRPTIVKNLISDNDGIGLFIRDKSWGIIKDNIVK